MISTEVPSSDEIFVKKVAQLGTEFGSISALAGAAKMAHTQLFRYMSGEASPTLSTIQRIAEAGGKPLAWFFTEEDGLPALPAHFGRVAFVPKIKSAASAGSGAQASYDVIDYVAFDKTWLSERTNGNGAAARALKAKGDSMMPDICNGDLLLVDTASTDASGAISVYIDDDDLFVKRLIKEAGRVLAYPSNPLYNRFDLTEHIEAGKAKIVGKVIWIGKEL